MFKSRVKKFCTILLFPPSLSGETLKKTSSKAVKRLQAVWEVLQAACRRGMDKEYLKFKVILQERHIYPKPKEVLKKEAATQVLILVQCLKRVSFPRNTKCLTFFFLNKKPLFFLPYVMSIFP